MTGPLEPSSGWPMPAIAAASWRYCSAVVLEPDPNDGSSATENSSDPKIPSSGPSQATGRVQPCRVPTQAISASSARRADSTSRTWNGPAAWRNVPHVVATGKTRLVTRKAAKLTMTSGRIAAPRIAHGRPIRPMSETGSPGRSRTLNRLWARPSTRISTSLAGPTAR